MSVEVLSTVETICTTNPQQIDVIELPVKVDRLVVNSHDSSISRLKVSSTNSTVDDDDDEFLPRDAMHPRY